MSSASRFFLVAILACGATAAHAAAGDLRTVAPLANGQWTHPSGDVANTRYSPLDQINTTNVANLKIKSTMTTGIPHGHEGQPLVVGNTMYIVTPFPNNLIAVDLSQPGGALLWVYHPYPSDVAVGKACCDIVNRGAAFADGKIIYNTLDNHTVAVDAKTGKELWKTALGDPAKGETMTMAPLVVKNRVIVGNSGGELGVRGWVVGLDLGSGKVVWKAYNTGPDADVLIGKDFHAFYPKDQGKDLGAKSWPGDSWRLGGATSWGWFSYDPETNLFFYGTSNPGPWNPDARPGDNKWSSTIFARDPETGKARWAFQETPHDSWDYDSVLEPIVVDMKWQGTMRKVLIHFSKNGFIFVIDRTNGEMLSAKPFVPVSWATGYDMKTGKPNLVPSEITHYGTETKGVCPSNLGGKDWEPSAISPRTGLVYIPAHNICMNFRGTAANYIAGTPYLGASWYMTPGPGGVKGELVAWDPVKAAPAWTVKEPKWPLYSGVLATGGDLVFYGTLDGWFKAVDARNGKELWKMKLASGIVGCPMTYKGPDGKQYIAIYAGIGGGFGAPAFPEVSEDDPTAAGGAVPVMRGIKKVTAPGDVLYVFGF